MKKFAIIFNISVLLLACGQKKESMVVAPKNNQISCENDSMHLVYYVDNTVEISKYNAIDWLYVINPSHTNQYERPDTTSKVFEYAQYGTQVHVYGYLDTITNGVKRSWAKCISSINRKVYVNNQEFMKAGYEIVYIKMNDLGAKDKLTMTKADLYKSLDDNYTKTVFTSLNLDILTKDQFYDENYRKNGTRIEYDWVYDAENSTGKVLLKLRDNDSTLVFENKENAEERTENRVYVKLIEEIECYLVFVRYYEGHAFELYDINNGQLKARMIGYPCFSPNYKYVAAFYANGYGESLGEMEIYSVSKTSKYKKYKSFKFVNWTPIENPLEIVWLTDNEFKIKAAGLYKQFPDNSTSRFFTEDGYVKVKIR